ncbi:hypothetical protein [Halosimplex salinum]|uniref:hypothetical protein n=1 Tax=Halosimplex salinum TaxID=1710538 RepID=UPI0013DE05DB|nr:hypothetical protein [Halosimplex salinum]
MAKPTRRSYRTPVVQRHGTVEQITRTGSGTNKVGDNTDEYSGATPLTGSVF